MIAAEALQGIAFPWLLVDRNGTLVYSADGALFPSPRYDIEGIFATGAALTDGGWDKCPNGYAVHRFTTEAIAPAYIVLHGLKIRGLSTATGRSENLSISISREEADRYVTSFKAALEAHDDHYKALIRQNIHEVRGINSALYNAAFELEDKLNQSRDRICSFISKNVVSLSELLRGRIDFMEFIANPNAHSVRRQDVFVYKQFDKLQKCFSVTASRRGIDLQMHGASVKAVSGPRIFELVPFLLIDNALKYSPDGRSIKISVTDRENSIICSVASIGPQIEHSELTKIFGSGVRGINAQRSGKEGSGLGLSVLRKIVDEVFHGRVDIRQSDPREHINGIPYCEVSFEVILPASNYRQGIQ